jgi:hypothetical protein
MNLSDLSLSDLKVLRDLSEENMKFWGEGLEDFVGHEQDYINQKELVYRSQLLTERIDEELHDRLGIYI